ncbi:MAG TPA: histidine kinase [Hansschlegelia sp.]
MSAIGGAVRAAPPIARAGRPPEARPAETLRRRILTVVVLIDVGCCLAAAAVEIVNARRATQVEMAASLEIAEPLVRETVTSFQRDVGRDVSDLQFALPGIRHVRIAVHRPDGSLIGSREPAQVSDAERAPAWFAALISGEVERLAIPVVVAGNPVALVAIHGEASDEIAEVWEDMTSLAILFAILNGVGLAAFALALGRILAPLGALADGLSDLERQRLERRLSIPRIFEFAALARRFNALAKALAAERETNALLSRRMVTLQDDERRQIAAELHDELGPCLFGLRANLGLLGRDIDSGLIGSDSRDRFEAAVEIAERLQSVNGRLLRKLRPMALGEAPLAEVLAGLLAEFERHHPKHGFALFAEDLASGYGDVADLTVYRSVQEGVTNALRHAACSAVSVHIRERDGDILVRVVDDGEGVPDAAPAGFGLVGLRDRLQALQGGFELRTTPQGAALEVTIPIHDSRSPGR